MPEERFLPSGEAIPDFMDGARDGFVVTIRDQRGVELTSILAEPRHFSTGSWGWMAAGKAELGWQAGRKVQINVQLVVIGSKPGSDKGPKP